MKNVSCKQQTLQFMLHKYNSDFFFKNKNLVQHLVQNLVHLLESQKPYTILGFEIYYTR